jgi:hypothetical protein
MSKETVLDFDNFYLSDEGFEFDASNEHGRISLMFSREWIEDHIGDDTTLERARQYLTEHREQIENAAIAKASVAPELGKPLGDLPYHGFIRAPFDQLIIRSR